LTQDKFDIVQFIPPQIKFLATPLPASCIIYDYATVVRRQIELGAAMLRTSDKNFFAAVGKVDSQQPLYFSRSILSRCKYSVEQTSHER